MTTTIKNIDTNEIIKVVLTDPETGCDWSCDFIGNANPSDLADCEDADWEGDTEAVDWWVAQADAYQQADNDAHDAISESDLGDEEILSLREEYVGGVEFNELPAALEAFADAVRAHTA